MMACGCLATQSMPHCLPYSITAIPMKVPHIMHFLTVDDSLDTKQDSVLAYNNPSTLCTC
jgi:hypothetical protein